MDSVTVLCNGSTARAFLFLRHGNIPLLQVLLLLFEGNHYLDFQRMTICIEAMLRNLQKAYVPFSSLEKTRIFCGRSGSEERKIIRMEKGNKEKQYNSVAQLCPTICDPMNCSMPGLPVHNQLPESTQTHFHWVGDAIQPSHPLSSPSPPSLNLSSIRVFLNESALHIRWPKYWSFSFSISPSNEHPWLISFRMDWLDLLAVQGTLKSLLQHHSS